MPTLSAARPPLPIARPENVSRVKHRGVFRYPGGKTWFAPTLLHWLAVHPPQLFVEAFAGGAALTATVLEHTRADIWLIEKDEDIAAVHHAVFSPLAPQLAQRILDFDLTLERVLEVLEREPATLLDRAFRTVLKNRVNRGGVMAPGAGLVKNGENGRGLSQRWYAHTLAERIHLLSAWRHRVRVSETDALDVLEQIPFTPGTVVFVDPPYTAGRKSAGKRLYRHHQLDHARLFCACAALKVPWLMTHEHDEQVMALAWERGLDWRAVKMTSGHNVTARELVIARDFDWARPLTDLALPLQSAQPSLFGPPLSTPQHDQGACP